MAKPMTAGPQANPGVTQSGVTQSCVRPRRATDNTVIPPIRKPFPQPWRRRGKVRVGGGNKGGWKQGRVETRAGGEQAWAAYRSGIEFLKTSLTISLIDGLAETSRATHLRE